MLTEEILFQKSILFSNIFYLKQFMSKKMAAEVQKGLAPLCIVSRFVTLVIANVITLNVNIIMHYPVSTG